MSNQSRTCWLQIYQRMPQHCGGGRLLAFYVVKKVCYTIMHNYNMCSLGFVDGSDGYFGLKSVYTYFSPRLSHACCTLH